MEYKRPKLTAECTREDQIVMKYCVTMDWNLNSFKSIARTCHHVAIINNTGTKTTGFLILIFYRMDRPEINIFIRFYRDSQIA